MSGRLADRVAVITGGASGIGEATARLFRAEGAKVLVADVQDDRGKTLVEELGEGVAYQRADVGREADVEAMIERAVSEFGRVDCLFNNAGFGGTHGPIDEIPADEFDETLGILLRGVFLGMKHVAPVMKRQGSGSIISTSSVAGIRPGLGPHVYSAAKAAVVHLTRCVALELAASGVRVNCICPGGVVTPLLTRALGDSDEVRRQVGEYLSTRQPIRRAGQPEDIARCALWLASDESSFVTAEAIVVDGGLTAGRPFSAETGRSRAWQPMNRPER